MLIQACCQVCKTAGLEGFFFVECLVVRQPTGSAQALKKNNNHWISFAIHSDSDSVPQTGDKTERRRN